MLWEELCKIEGSPLFVKKLLSFCKVALAALLPGGRMWYTGRSKRVEAHFIAIFSNSLYQNDIFAICSLRMLPVH